MSTNEDSRMPQTRTTDAWLRDLQERIAQLPRNEVPVVCSALQHALKSLSDVASKGIQIGSWVTFSIPQERESLVGRVTKVNRKTIKVQVISPKSRHGQTWRVAPSLLSPAAPIVASRVDSEQATRLACEACAEERFGADQCEARHLVERGGLHLVFVETPAHGYFLTVDQEGIARFVGEEDCGISDSRVRRLFGIGVYAEEYMNWV